MAVNHSIVRKTSHKPVNGELRAFYAVTCTCGEYIITTDSRTAADRYAQEHLVSPNRNQEEQYAANEQCCWNEPQELCVGSKCGCTCHRSNITP